MASRSRRSNPASDIFYAWSVWSIIGFWLITVLIVLSVIFLNVPIGVSFFLAIFLLPLIWKDPDKEDYINGAMVRETIPWKIATFMNVLKGPARQNVFQIDNLLGVGPPEDDPSKNITEHFFSPPGRISAYFSMGFAFVLSFLDYLIHPILYPLWGSGGEGFLLPAIVSQILSFVAFYAGIQALNTARRYHLAIPMSGVDKVPAVIWHKIPKDGTKRSALIKFAQVFVISFVMSILISIIIAMIHPINWWIGIGLSFITGISLGIYLMLRDLTEAYRLEFNEQVERRDFFNGVWGYMNMKIPYFDSQVPVPGEPGKPGGPPEGSDEIPETHVWVATFGFPTNGTYADYANEADKIIPSIPEAEMLVISPVPKKLPSGESIPGTVSASGFRIWWSDMHVSLNELLKNPDITPEMKEIAVRYNVVEPLAKIRQINRCIVHSHSMMTAPDSEVNIMKVSLVPPDGVTEKNFTDNIDKMQQSLGISWIRAKKSVDQHGRSIIELYLGDGTPLDDGIVFPKGIASSKFRKRLMAIHWEYIFAINGVNSSNGSPTVIMSRDVTDKSEEIIFDLPAGVDSKRIKKDLSKIKDSSGNGYLEFHAGIPSKKQFSRREKREIDKFMKSHSSTAQFTLVASKTHPLEDTFLFSNYKNELITGRELGVLKSQWGVGVKSNGYVAKHSFEKGADPHLVLAGSSGSGKSALLYSMLCQLASNNYPEDLQLQIIDPKIGFQGFQYIDNVTRYVDQHTPRKGHFFESCRDLLRDASIEMNRRNEVFRFATHTDGITPYEDEMIDKLSTARRIGIKQGPMDDGSPNPLVMPLLVIIIDECAMLFADAPDKETRELQSEILYYACKLARESRSAGIHCLFSTQYPTKASLPSIIKQQSGRIGLKTQDNIASRVIIDEDGLEELELVGMGKISEGRSYVDFRGFLLEEDSLGEHSMSEILNSLPKREPSVEIDGADAVKRYEQVQALKSGKDPNDVKNSTGKDNSKKYYTASAVEPSIFDSWDRNKKGTAAVLRAATTPKVDDTGKITKRGSKADKIKTILEDIDFESMPDEKFDMTLEEFKKLVK